MDSARFRNLLPVVSLTLFQAHEAQKGNQPDSNAERKREAPTQLVVRIDLIRKTDIEVGQCLILGWQRDWD